ncbi:MAG: NnrS family protein [Chrysiogenetes bacterium]|nr:NnrS family protein [Chrysiogenetes bacterium]
MSDNPVETSKNAFTPRTELWREPYRAFFGFGSLYALGFFVLWGLQLRAWALGVDPPAPGLGIAQHAHIVIWGIVGAYVFGFALTAYPKQNDGPSLPKRLLQGLWALFVTAQAGLVAAWIFGFGSLLTPALLLETAAYVLLFSYLAPMGIRQIGQRLWVQALGVLVALATGIIALVLHGFGPPTLQWAAVHLALWNYLLFLIASFVYRLLPFFTSRVCDYEMNRGRFFLPVLWVLLLAKTLVVPAGSELASRAIDAAAFAWCFAEWVRYAPGLGVRVPMVSVLHLGWCWVMGALALGAINPGILQIHMLTVGGVVGFLMAISTRVSLGHGGRPIVLGKAAIAAIVLVQFATLARVLAPTLLPDVNAYQLYHVSAHLLALAFLIWVIRFGPILVLAKIPPKKECPV